MTPLLALHAATAALPVRWEATLLGGGWRGSADDDLLPAAGLLIDAGFEGAIALEGARVLGWDRRRLVAGESRAGIEAGRRPRRARRQGDVRDAPRLVRAGRGLRPRRRQRGARRARPGRVARGRLAAPRAALQGLRAARRRRARRGGRPRARRGRRPRRRAGHRGRAGAAAARDRPAGARRRHAAVAAHRARARGAPAATLPPVAAAVLEALDARRRRLDAIGT